MRDNLTVLNKTWIFCIQNQSTEFLSVYNILWHVIITQKAIAELVGQADVQISFQGIVAKKICKGKHQIIEMT
jgi:hypothetical protein